MLLRQPLPASCRDTVTGNAFFHGCVDELTWFLEDKSVWIAAIAIALSTVCVSIIYNSRGNLKKKRRPILVHRIIKYFFFCQQVIDAVMSIVLIQALKKEEEEARTYRH